MGIQIRESLCRRRDREKCSADQRDKENAQGGPWIPFSFSFLWREMAVMCRDSQKVGQEHVMSELVLLKVCAQNKSLGKGKRV